MASSITIKAGQYHTFVNSSETEELVVQVDLSPSHGHWQQGLSSPLFMSMDEKFFRNWYCYFDDCDKAGVEPSLFQLMLWLWIFECYIVLPGPWPQHTRKLRDILSKYGTFLLGVVVGKWLLGYEEAHQNGKDGGPENGL